MSPNQVAKSTFNTISLLLTAPLGLSCWLEAALRGVRGSALFDFWAQLLAMFPGTPGAFIRRGFYRWTLTHCSSHCHIGFGVIFTHRDATVADHVYIGAYSLIGHARIGEGSLIGSRTSLLSGGHQHKPEYDGSWSAADPSSMHTIEIGKNVWIGEGAILMANVADGAMVASGAVVSAPVPTRIMVAGNPCRFVRRIELPQKEDSGEEGVSDGLRRVASATEQTEPQS